MFVLYQQRGLPHMGLVIVWGILENCSPQECPERKTGNASRGPEAGGAGFH